MLYEQFGELKYKYRNREFRCRGYYVDTAGKNTSRIVEYIQNQIKEDQLGEQLTIPGSSPFYGRQVIVSQLADRFTRLTCHEEQRALPTYKQPPAWLVVVY